MTTENKILIVDDEENIRWVFAQALEEKPLTVHTAASAEEALEKIANHNYLLVFTDIFMPGMGGTQRLARLLGRAKALEVCTSGAALSADAAKEIGLVNMVFEEEGYWDKVMEYAGQFVPPKKASMSVGMIKRAIQTGADISLPDGLALEREVLQRAFDSDDAKEGLKAYLEKRTANFEGK